jgi:flagellin
MSSINTNIGALVATTNLNKAQTSLNTSLQRLSSGLRINSGADDPAGLIASESLKAEIQGINSAITNSTQATNVISTADAALAEVSNLLVSINGLVVQSANTGGLSADEIQANQLQVNSAISSITRIANSTTFGGINLLNGSLGYITSGVATSALQDVTITNASFGTHATIPVVVSVLQSAQNANLRFNASAIATSVSLQITGAVGSQELDFISGTKASAIAFAINGVSDSTGVSAALTSAANVSSGITLSSTNYGSTQFVSVAVKTGNPAAFATTDESGASEERVSGQDAIVSINGVQAVVDGLSVSLNSPSLNLTFNLNKDFGVGTEAFTITGGGAVFQLGSSVQSNEQVGIAIQSVAAGTLGNANDGYLTDLQQGGSASLAKDPSKASKIITDAINQVSDLRGRLGAFEANTLQTNINSLQVALENATSSESTIEDTDFATETSNLTREQVLVSAGTSVLAQAQQTPQLVLKLLQ